MPLYDITNHRPILVKPTDAEFYDVIQAAKKRLHPQRFEKDVRTFDDAIQEVLTKATSTNKLAFTKAGFVVGYSRCTDADVNHFWESAEIAFQFDILPTAKAGGFPRPSLPMAC